jgi:cyclophilin family peptidyl-prolyl cis-trans isomerase
VIAGFVAQAGDPQTKENRGDFAELGAGNPGYRFEVEFPPEETRYTTYTVAMANGVDFDPATFEILGNTESNGSQFFVALAELPLPPYYSIVGRVSDGTETIDAIGAVPVNGPRGLPLDPVIIETVTVESGPAATPAS